MKPTVTFDDFMKLDIRIATVLSAEPVEGSEKLLKLEMDIGDEKRQLIAGIAKAIPDPNELIGKQIPMIVNLEPKTMMGLESQGMMLAASKEGKPILLHPVEEVPNGSEVR